jgi:peptide/nickel transport system substrate-binding protein
MQTSNREGALSTGSSLQSGKYTIQETLGAGGFGITYRATDELLGRAVAIKELYPQGCGREGNTITLGGHYTPERWDKAVAAFLREARLLANTDHPGIVTVYDYFRENNTAYMVMKYIKGTTLTERVAKGGVLPVEAVKRYAAEIGDALSVLHAQGVLHRDIKPSNIMLTAQDRPVLVDFGAAREFVTDRTGTYTSMGTLGFAPPEQFYTKLPQGPYTDIYGLAATCYYLLTGQSPNLADLEAASSLDPRIQAVLEHGLAISPGDRPQDVATFMAELEGSEEPPQQPYSNTSFSTTHQAVDVIGVESEADDDTLLLKPSVLPSELQPSKRLALGNEGAGEEFIDETMSLTPGHDRNASRQATPAENPQTTSPQYDIGPAYTETSRPTRNVMAMVLVPMLLVVLLGIGAVVWLTSQGGNKRDTPGDLPPSARAATAIQATVDAEVIAAAATRAANMTATSTTATVIVEVILTATSAAISATPTEGVMVQVSPLPDDFLGTPSPTNTPPALATATLQQPTEMPDTQFIGLKYAAPNCTYGGLMKSIEAIDSLTVKFTLCAPDPAFPSKIAFSSLGIQSAKHLQETGGKPLEKTLGSGPYMVQEWVRGDHLTLVANPKYWGEAPKMKTLIYKWNKEAAARLTSIKAGEADGMDNPDPNDFASIKSDTSLQLFPREALNVFYIGLNNTKPPLDNEKVRQAIAMGINRQAIVDKFYPAGSLVASHFTPCAIPGGCEGEEWYKFDLDAAKKLLAESGVATPIKMRVSYRDVVRGYLPTPSKVAEEIQAQMKALGIELTIDQQESGTFLDNTFKGNEEVFLLGWGADYPDAINFLDSHFGTEGSNSFGKKWGDITSRLAKAASLSDMTTRKTLYGEVNSLIKQHVPMVPVSHGGSATVYRAKVLGAHSSPLGTESFKVMSVEGKDTFVWLQNAEPLSLYCGDETDGESLRACEQIFDPLLSYKLGGTEVELNLASSYVPNTNLTEWIIKLRPNIKFSDNTPMTVNDVVTTYAVQWDANHPLHIGNTGNFDYWTYLFTQFLNAPPPQP